MRAYHFDRHVLPLRPGHPFPVGKYARLRERLRAEPGGIELVDAEPATEGELALAHDPAYVGAVLEGTLDAARQREIGFPWSPEMAVRALHSVGATIGASRAALAEGVAANLGGGTHHASADRGGGYCVFNDVGVAARLMQAEWHRHHRALLPVLVVDLDVHQGNGTASVFARDDTVFTFSMHGERNFPFRKVAGDLDVGLPDGCGDDEYLHALDAGLDEAWRRQAARPPGLAYYLAGADPHEGDRLGRLRLTMDGLRARDERVLSALRARGIPVVLAMAGGYGRDIERTVDVHVQTLRLAQAHWQAWREAAPRGGAPAGPMAAAAAAASTGSTGAPAASWRRAGVSALQGGPATMSGSPLDDLP